MIQRADIRVEPIDIHSAGSAAAFVDMSAEVHRMSDHLPVVADVEVA